MHLINFFHIYPSTLHVNVYPRLFTILMNGCVFFLYLGLLIQASFSLYICVIFRTDNVIMLYHCLTNSILLFQLFNTFFLASPFSFSL